MRINYYPKDILRYFRGEMMSKKSTGKAKPCDKYTASTLAASSIMQYFGARNWKMISFFPNSVCVKEKKCNK